MTVYIINTKSKITSSVRTSQEGYASMEEAHKAVTHRAGHPEKVNDWLFENKYWIYEIVKVTIA